MSHSIPHIVVVGDALLDVDIDGTVSRICPDAPVPVFDETHATPRAGGAALAATLAARTGAEVTLVTAVGDDDSGETLLHLLAHEGVEVIDLRLSGATPEKVRMRSNGQSLLRVDRGGPEGVVGEAIADAVRAVGLGSAVLAADYGRGVTDLDPLRQALDVVTAPLVWDPHPRGGPPVAGATVVTPSQAELFAAVPEGQQRGSELGACAERAQALVGQWSVGSVAVTMGAAGAMLARAEGAPLVVPARAITAGDPCGAGDAFAAAVTSLLGSGIVLPEAIERATAIATDFVEAGGAAALTVAGARPAAEPPNLRPGRAPWHGANRAAAAPVDEPTVVATGGCFDLLHAGHVSLLETAAALGDRLVVLINSDRSVARLKGPGRPIQSEADRRAVLLALACVDDVVIFDEDTPSVALDRLRPAVFVKGGDYAGVVLPEAEVLGRWGGQIAIVPYLDGRSTTRIVQEARRGN